MQKRLFGLLLSGLLVAAACGGTTASTAPDASGAPAAPAESAAAAPSIDPAAPIDITTTAYAPEPAGNTGGKLVFSTTGEPSMVWWNIYDNFAATVEGFSMSLWSLWSNTDDFKYYGQLATEVPTVENGGVVLTGDGMDVTINLVPGAQWSDGEAIDCEDVKYMVEWIMDPAQVGLVTGTTGWEDITSVDGGAGDSTCVAHFSQVYEQYASLWSPLLPEHYLKTHPDIATVTEALYPSAVAEDVAKGVYSGPYLPTSWVKEAQIDYVPNPKFWETIKKATPNFDSVTFKFYADPQAQIAGFVNGEADVSIEFNHTHLPMLAAVPPDQVSTIDGLTYEHNTWNRERLETKFGVEGSKALLNALHYAYNKDEINQRVLSGTATPSCNFNSPLAWSYHEVPCYPFDVAKANEILDAGGFAMGADGFRTFNGQPFELEACTRSDRQYRIDTLRLVATQLQAVGLKLNLDNVAADPNVLFSPWTGGAAPDAPCNLTRGNYDVTEFAWVSTPDPNSIHGIWHSSKNPSIGDHSGANYARVNDADLDAKMDAMLRTVDLKKIQADMVEIQELYVNPENAFPEIALYNWRTVLLKSPTMHNIANNSTSATQVWNIEDWWRDAQ